MKNLKNARFIGKNDNAGRNAFAFLEKKAQDVKSKGMISFTLDAKGRIQEADLDEWANYYGFKLNQHGSVWFVAAKESSVSAA
jgi:hypothetical protein